MEESRFKTKDQKEIYIRKFEVEESRASVLIAHGMAEHGDRYIEFAEYLNKHLFNVYIPDHRGHGKTISSEEEYGFFGEKDGWNAVTDDLKTILETMKREHPDQKCFLFGHSMGSLLFRTMMIRHPEQYDGVILSGTAGDMGLLTKLGQIIAFFELKIKGPRAKSPLMDKLSFGGFNKRFKDAKTPFDWLSRDEESVRAYIQDEHCGGVFSTSFYKDLVDASIFVNDIHQIAKMNRKTPVFFISGSEDPVGGKVIKEISSKMNRKGIRSEYKLYEGSRHEILNEINKEDVYRDVVDWLDKNMDA